MPALRAFPPLVGGLRESAATEADATRDDFAERVLDGSEVEDAASSNDEKAAEFEITVVYVSV